MARIDIGADVILRGISDPVDANDAVSKNYSDVNTYNMEFQTTSSGNAFALPNTLDFGFEVSADITAGTNQVTVSYNEATIGSVAADANNSSTVSSGSSFTVGNAPDTTTFTVVSEFEVNSSTGSFMASRTNAGSATGALSASDGGAPYTITGPTINLPDNVSVWVNGIKLTYGNGYVFNATTLGDGNTFNANDIVFTRRIPSNYSIHVGSSNVTRVANFTTIDFNSPTNRLNLDYGSAGNPGGLPLDFD